MVLAVIARDRAALAKVLEGGAMLADGDAACALSHAGGTAAVPESVPALPARKGHSQRSIKVVRASWLAETL